MEKQARENLKIKKILVEWKYFDDRKKYLKENVGPEISGVIRIHDDEYKNIDREKEFLTHFNLQVSHHKVGNIYILPRILKSGFFTEEKEKLPNLSFKNVIKGECVEVREYLKYEELEKNDFEFSFENIKNSEELEKIIYERYSKSMPNLSKKEILDLGVSLTKLRILR